jgi:hypothetical protein
MKNKIISTLTSFQSGTKDILVVLGRAIPALVAELVLALLDTLRIIKQQQNRILNLIFKWLLMVVPHCQCDYNFNGLEL